MKRFLLFVPALAAANVETEATCELSSGYRADHYRQTATLATVPSTAKFKNFGSALVGFSGRLGFNRSFFARSFGTFDFMVRQPKLEATGSALTFGDKKYVFTFGGAIGWQFDLADDTVVLCPEFGYDYTRLKYDNSKYIAVGAPFAGLSLTWDFATKASVDIGFEYAFAGARREIFFSGNDKITDGSFQGPKAKLHFTYHFTPKWSLGAGYTYRYLFSQRKNFTLSAGSVDGLKTTWTTQSAKINIGYTF